MFVTLFSLIVFKTAVGHVITKYRVLGLLWVTRRREESRDVCYPTHFWYNYGFYWVKPGMPKSHPSIQFMSGASDGSKRCSYGCDIQSVA